MCDEYVCICSRVESGSDDLDNVGHLFFDGQVGLTKLSGCDPDF